jgi:glyoxylase I family protein
MLHRFVFCLASIAVLCVNAGAQENVQDELLAQEKKLIAAINKKDKAALRDLLADEVMSITASRGRQTKAEIIAALERISFSDYEISDAKTIRITPDVAILTYNFSWTGGVTGQPATKTNAFATSVWKRRDAKWRSVFYQETPRTAR